MAVNGNQDIQAVKDRLMDYREREREIDNQIERIENLQVKMVSLQSPEMSGMPRPSFSASDRIGQMLARKDEMERHVKKLINYQESERLWIQGVLSHLKKADERACIQMRYIDVESWPAVASMLFGNNQDFEERKDSYLRRTTHLHGRALQRIAEYLETQKDYQSELV